VINEEGKCHDYDPTLEERYADLNKKYEDLEEKFNKLQQNHKVLE